VAVKSERGRGLAGAVTLLTVIPAPWTREPDPTGGAGWFPVVGAAVGALAGGVRLATGPLVGATAASVLAMVALVAATGALHVDGLADTADGLGARGGGSERRLAVMRDSATGAFGVLALIGWALLLLSALAPLSGLRALRVLVVAGAVGRWAALGHAVAAPAARSDGLGAAFAVSRPALAVAGALTVAIALAVGDPGPGAVALGAALAVTALTSLYTRRALGGRTGDTLGATIALAELATALVLMAFWRA
jgi:adenosylcobinamide-GDP ribazoletransferase